MIRRISRPAPPPGTARTGSLPRQPPAPFQEHDFHRRCHRLARSRRLISRRRFWPGPTFRLPLTCLDTCWRGLPGTRTVRRIASHGLHQLPEPPTSGAGQAAAAAELERLRALGYVSGRSAVTPMARVNLGEILFRRGANKEAIHELEAAVAADPRNQRAGLWLARAYAGANRPADAVRVYDRLLQDATASAPADPIAALAATDLDLAQGRTAEAAARLSRLSPALARDPDAVLARGAVADAQHRTAEAERLFRMALSAAPTSVDALSRLIDLLLRTGRSEAAAQVAGEAVRRFPDSPERHALVGEAALAGRRAADASQAFRQALGVGPGFGISPDRTRTGRAPAEPRRCGVRGCREPDRPRRGNRSWRRASRTSGTGRLQWRPIRVRRLMVLPSVELLNALGNAQFEAGRAADAAATFDRSLALKNDQPAIRSLAERARTQVGKRQ